MARSATTETTDAAPGLEAGLAALGFPADPTVVSRFTRFLALIRQWNRVYNLTAIEHPADMVTRHLLDSLSLHALLQGPRALDVGTGAGFPGVPLAIVDPTIHWALLDSREKRTRFLHHAITELALSNVTVVTGRIEQHVPVHAFDSIVSRAFGSLADFVRVSAHALAPTGQWLAMKGVAPHEELADPALASVVAEVIPLAVPGLAAHRHVVRMRRRD